MEKGTRGLMRQKPDYGRPWSGRRAWAVQQACPDPVLAWPFTNQVTWQVQQGLFSQALVLGSGNTVMMGLTLPSWSLPSSEEM